MSVRTSAAGLPGFVRTRLVAAMGLGILCAALTACGNGEPEGRGTSAAAASTIAATPPSSGPPSPSASADPTPTISDTPTSEAADTVTGTPDEETLALGDGEASALWGKKYSGTADISVRVYDYCNADGSRRLADSQTYAANSTLDLGRPRTGGDETEDNPFSLLFAAGDPAQAGAVSFWSSAVSTTSGQDLAGNPRDPHLLLTYWDVDWSGGELDARLTDPHTREAVALNLINWSSPVVACRNDLGSLPGGYPHALATGTTFRGPLDASTASLTAEGTSTDGLVEFRIEFEGAAS
ncbi:hypothetical protein [Streptomyces sp. Tue6028]|uniref:hypothetical protein n=1 Tax=Streptomyces sp. Tue6028 TaxID=2036037 RepID=UPI003D749349